MAVQGSPAYDVTGGIVLLLVAGGVWCLSHGMRVSQAPSYLLYNIRALQRRSLYQIEACETGPLRRLLLVEKSELDRLQAVGTAVLTVAAAWSACLFFLPTLETPLWWVPLVAGFAARDLLDVWAVARAKRRFAALAEKDAGCPAVPAGR